MNSYAVKTIQGLLLVGVFIWAMIAQAEEKSAIGALLINLEGWKAEKPESVSTDLNGLKMESVIREYVKGNLRLEVALMLGDNVLIQGKIAETTGEGKLTSAAGASRASLSKLDGFQVYAAEDKANAMSNIVVFLAQTEKDGALFTLSGEGVAAQEALDLAKKFDWQKMKTEMKQLLAQKKGVREPTP